MAACAARAAEVVAAASTAFCGTRRTSKLLHRTGDKRRTPEHRTTLNHTLQSHRTGGRSTNPGRRGSCSASSPVAASPSYASSPCGRPAFPPTWWRHRGSARRWRRARHAPPDQIVYSAAVHVYSQARGLAAMQAKLLVSKHVSCLALQVRKLASRTPKRRLYVRVRGPDREFLNVALQSRSGAPLTANII